MEDQQVIALYRALYDTTLLLIAGMIGFLLAALLLGPKMKEYYVKFHVYVDGERVDHTRYVEAYSAEDARKQIAADFWNPTFDEVYLNE